MPSAELFLPEAQAIGESRPHNRRSDPWLITVSQPWLSFFRVLIFYLKKIFLTGVQNGIIVTDDEGNAMAVPFLTENVPYDAAAFTADVGAWTVDEADIVNFSRLPLGNMRWFDFNIQNTTVTATPTILSVTIPGGGISAHFMQAVCEIDDGGTLTSGLAYVEENGTTINFVRQDRAALAISADATAVRGQLLVEIL
jgi:hypothetical protein